MNVIQKFTYIAIIALLVIGYQAKGAAIAHVPTSVTASTEFGSFVDDNLFLQTNLSGTFTSGTTPYADLSSITASGNGWAGETSNNTGTLNFTLSSSLTVDRVGFWWNSNGGNNNFTTFNIKRATDASFTSFSTLGTGGPPSTGTGLQTVTFTPTAVQHLQIEWTGVQGSRPGANVFVVGVVPEPSSYGLLFGLCLSATAVVRRLRSKKQSL